VTRPIESSGGTPPTSALLSLAADVGWPDNEAAAAARAALAAAPDDPGRLGELAEWLAGVQGHHPPHDFARVRAVVFGTGSAPAAGLETFADLAGAGIGTVPQHEQPATAAIAAGAALADAEVDTGADLLIVAVPGRDAVIPALAIVSVLTNTEPVKVLSRGGQLAPEDWMAQAVAVRDARRRAMPHRAEPVELLDAIGNAHIAAAAGFVLRAAGRRTPVLLDGLPATAAALVAYEAQPRAVRWWDCADRSTEPAHELALTKLGKRSVLDLGIGQADGTGGLLAVPVLRAAVRTLARLAAAEPPGPPGRAGDAGTGDSLPA
jgi:nicotinate-nucleotide--dimethylbenzimidazole phosphoribosyltransferase